MGQVHGLQGMPFPWQVAVIIKIKDYSKLIDKSSVKQIKRTNS